MTTLTEKAERIYSRHEEFVDGAIHVAGMLFANRCSWAHLVDGAATLAGWPRDSLLTPAERAAVDGHGNPADLKTPGK